MKTDNRPVISETICVEAQEFLKNIIKSLDDGDILTSLDRYSIELLGNTYDSYIRATKVLQDKGFTQLSPRGEDKARPEVKIQMDALIQITKIMDSFGLSPKARKEISKPKEKEGKLSPLDVFLQTTKK